VCAEAGVTGHGGRHVAYVVRAFDEKEESATGTYKRAVLDRAKLDQRFETTVEERS
jgi:predicted thioesterase